VKSPKKSWSQSYLDRKMSPGQQHEWRAKMAAGLTLSKVMSGSLALIRVGAANIHVDRMGRATLLKVRE
jgi:hypothetical protein